MPRTLHARWILPFVLVIAAIALWRDARAPHWRALAPGIEFGTLRGEPWCKRGSSVIAAVRFDPARVTLRARHFSRLPDPRPLSIVEWQRATHADVVFNAGQFYPDLRYMGVFVSDGDVISAREHAGFRAALVARDDGRGARLLDLTRTPLDEDSTGWGQVAQSFMLFERGGTLRVRRSERISNRTIVAEDAHGRLVVCVTEGGYALSDLAECLERAPLSLVQAMSMDGGLESELVVARRGFRYASFGAWRDDAEPVAPGATTPLPAVITLETR